MHCEYCNEKEDDIGLFSLPCGYLICSHHIHSAEDYFECFFCDEHMINRQSCLQMPRNRKKMEKMSVIEQEKDILNICDQIDQFKLDQKSFIGKESDNIINKIDLKREVLKTNLNKLVDNYYESLLNDVQEKQLNIIDSIKADFEGINTQEIRQKLNLDLDKNSTDYQVQIEFLVELRSRFLDEHLKNFKNFKNIAFFEGEEEPQVKMSKLFGTIDLRDSNDTFGGKTEKSAYSKTLSNEFKLIAKVGLEKILELSNGEVVFTSQSKKSNLLIFNPQNGKTKEINGQHDIKYLFKTDNDEIIIIDSEFYVKIWYDYKCVNTYDIVRRNYSFVELVKDKIITLSSSDFYTALNCYNGQVLNHIYFEKKCSVLTISFQKFITNYKFEGFVRGGLPYVGFSLYNIQTGKPEKYKEIQKHSIGNISTIEKINKDEFIIESDIIPGEISILNADLSKKLSKRCHNSKISTFVPCENGLIVSICVNGEIKIWDQNNLRFIKETTAINPTYARILKSGRLVYIDKSLNCFISS